jgi:hypothetical protein
MVPKSAVLYGLHAGVGKIKTNVALAGCITASAIWQDGHCVGFSVIQPVSRVFSMAVLHQVVGEILLIFSFRYVLSFQTFDKQAFLFV